MLDFLCTGAEPCVPTLRIAQILACALLGILFLQSGLDKVFDWEGNVGWISEHLAKTPMGGVVPLLLGIITLLEIAAGALCAVGAVTLLVSGSATLGVLGVALAGLTLVMLFFGQRTAKDYAGAAQIAPYFVIVLVGLYLLGL